MLSISDVSDADWRAVPSCPGYLVGTRGEVWSERLGRVIASHGHSRGFDRVHVTVDGDALNNQLANLAWGTKLQNADDMRRHGTHAIGARNTCGRGHLYVAASLHLQTNGARTCRACKWATDVTRTHPDTYDTQALANLLYAHLVDGGPDPRHSPDLQRSARLAVGSPC